MSRLSSRKRAFERQAIMVFIAALTLVASGDSAASQGVRKDDIQKMSRLSGLPTTSVVSVRQGLAVAIRERGVRSPAGIVEGVLLHGEVLDPDLVADIGYASMTSRIDVDCANRRDRVTSMEAFSSPGLQGAPERRSVPGGWIQPSPQAYLADVLRAVCGGRRDMGVQVASLDDSDTPITTNAGKRPTLRPAIGLSPSNAPEPAPAPVQKTPAPKPVASAPAKAVAAAPTRATGSVAVQVAAVVTRDAAEDAARKAARRAPQGVVARVESATVDGRGFYRALVHGFENRADASRFCKTLIADGGACFVR